MCKIGARQNWCVIHNRFWFSRDRVCMACCCAVVSRIVPWIVVIVLILLVAAINGPNCPAEDSCYPEYENGHWSIVQGQR